LKYEAEETNYSPSPPRHGSIRSISIWGRSGDVSAASGVGIRSKKWLVDQPASREIERWESDTRRDASGERQRAKSPHHGREGCWR
jgi:hypothetical protein